MDAAGRYAASFVVEADPQILPETDTETGIDLGLTHFAVLADGTKFSTPRFLRRAEKKLKRMHKIIRDNQAVFVETLSAGALGRTRLAKSVYDAGWAAFVGMLEYKAVRHGRTFAKVDRAFPSSQICSACGFRDGPKPLHVRTWTCRACGAVHDRDDNAAKNVLAEGRRIVAAGRAETLNTSQSAGKTRVKAPAQRSEAGSPRKGQPTRAGIPTLQAGSASIRGTVLSRGLRG